MWVPQLYIGLTYNTDVWSRFFADIYYDRVLMNFGKAKNITGICAKWQNIRGFFVLSVCLYLSIKVMIFVYVFLRSICVLIVWIVFQYSKTQQFVILIPTITNMLFLSASLIIIFVEVFYEIRFSAKNDQKK